MLGGAPFKFLKLSNYICHHADGNESTPEFQLISVQKYVTAKISSDKAAIFPRCKIQCNLLNYCSWML